MMQFNLRRAVNSPIHFRVWRTSIFIARSLLPMHGPSARTHSINRHIAGAASVPACLPACCRLVRRVTVQFKLKSHIMWAVEVIRRCSAGISFKMFSAHMKYGLSHVNKRYTYGRWRWSRCWYCCSGGERCERSHQQYFTVLKSLNRLCLVSRVRCDGVAKCQCYASCEHAHPHEYGQRCHSNLWVRFVSIFAPA